MTSGALHNAVNHPVTPAQIKVAGMAGDLYGRPDGRSPLVLLNGLTYARATWQPVLSHLGQIHELQPESAAWIAKAAPHMVIEVWAGSGHFPISRSPQGSRNDWPPWRKPGCPG
jgi:hypothetical protein